MAKAQNFNAEKAFQQDLSPMRYSPFRSANGAPASNYWQNRADYNLEVDFDTATRILSGTAVIHYQNNSPNNLSFLWLALSQNTDKKEALGQVMKQPTAKKDSTIGFKIEKVLIKKNNRWMPVDFKIYGTVMQILLAAPLSGNGSKITLKIAYHFKLLKRSAAGRAGILATKEGSVFELSYFYPRMCVFDDLHGWNTLPFIGSGEFYCEYGNFDYTITVPSGMLVASAGQLINANDILSDKILKNLRKARSSDKTVIIRSAADVGKISPTKKKTGRTTWHFKMENTRDVAFACSESFVWDGAKIDLPGNKTSFAQSFYPSHSAKPKNGWQRATEFLKASVEIFSKHWFVYPYKNAVNVAGSVGGMEFPGITFDWHNAKGKSLWMVISHEIGHSWFPMIVGSNERRHPFMDEGFNVFIDIYAQDEFNGGEFAPKRDGEYAPKGGNPADEIIPVIKELKNSYTLMDAPDEMDYKYIHPLFYFKTAFGLVLLREVILGHDRFDYAFRTYIRRWAYKHPSPSDFFKTMDNASGMDLTWFWRGWFYHNWLLDQSVESVSYKDNNPANGASITIKNNDQLALPVPMLIKEANGKTHRFQLPVNIWTHGAEWTFHVATTSKIKLVEIDPDHQLPDANRKNNIWKPSGK